MNNSNDGRRTSDLIIEAGTVLRLFFIGIKIQLHKKECIA